MSIYEDEPEKAAQQGTASTGGQNYIEDAKLVTSLSSLSEFLETESQIGGLLHGYNEVSHSLLERIAHNEQDPPARRDIDASDRTDRATRLVKASSLVSNVIFGCPLDAPPSPVQYRWRPHPTARMILMCQHGPPEHCWYMDERGRFEPDDC